MNSLERISAMSHFLRDMHEQLEQEIARIEDMNDPLAMALYKGLLEDIARTWRLINAYHEEKSR